MNTKLYYQSQAVMESIQEKLVVISKEVFFFVKMTGIMAATILFLASAWV